MHRFEFDETTLSYFLSKIKEQLDKKYSREYFLVEVDEDTEGALIIGTHDIDPVLEAESGFKTGTSVLIKERIMLEIDFTNEEKQAISYFVEQDGAASEIDDRLANFKFEVIDPGDFLSRYIVSDLDPKTFYIISKNADIEGASHVAFINDISTKSMLQNFIDTKVDKVDGRELSDVDFIEEYQRILDDIIAKKNELIMSKDIVDALDNEAIDKPLSANQGNVLRTEYFDDHQFEYEDLSDDNVVYGLTEEQVNMLQQAYCHTFIDPAEEYASLQEVYNARFNLDNTVERTLKDRINKLEARLNHSVLNVDLMEDMIGFYGVHADFEDQTFKRIGKAIGLQSRDFDNIYPWAGMKRCNIKDGEILCYEGEEEYKEDGSNGDVMVEIPKFWYKVMPIKLEDAASGEGQQIVEAKWMIANKPSKGFKVHPAFIRNNIEVDHVYIGAYEACVYDQSELRYLLFDEQQMDAEVDALSSIKGAIPCSGATQKLTLDNCRKMTQNKGTNYGLMDFTVISAIQLLLLIEHASFDSQTCVGDGISNFAIGEGNASLNTGSDKAVVYRNIENLWGNMWVWIDGINIEANSIHYAYWGNDNYVSGTNDNYTKIDFKLCLTTNYINRFGYDIENDFVFLPTEATGSSIIAPYDYLWQNNSRQGWNSYFIGGCWHEGNKVGCWNIAIDDPATTHAINLSARIQYFK